MKTAQPLPRKSARSARRTLAVMFALSAGLAPAMLARAQATTAPAMAPAATSPTSAPTTGRTQQQVTLEFVEADRAVQEMLPDRGVLRDPAAREKLAAKAVPAIQKSMALLDELAARGGGEAMSPEALADSILVQRIQTEPLLIAFGDPAAKERAATRAASKDPIESALGRGEQLIAAFWVAEKEPDQLKVVGDLEKFLKESQPNIAVDFTAGIFLIHPSASDAVTDQLIKLAKATPPGPLTENVLTQVEARKIQKGFENKPIVLAGTLVDGKPFTTADWKGKVILVDFWATWCVPCLEELPHLKETYKKYHDKGLEVVGVSNDYSASALTGFLKENADLVWPTLFDAAAGEKKEMHPLSEKHGIIAIPVMFLIDRKGVLRTVEGRENMGELIPKLLAEPAE